MPSIAFLYTTVSDKQTAERLAKEVVKSKIAACVNIISNVLSIYEWEGKIEKTDEYVLLFKTSVEQLSKLESWIIEKHPYKVPAIIKGTAESSVDFFHYICEQVKE
jgi:periplasmic divalent cation tolerance protein